jgi:hypothetical protein
MSIFKQNSRFSVLAEDISIKEIKNNNKKPENRLKNEENSFKKTYNDKPYNSERNSLTNKYSKEQLERRAIEEQNRAKIEREKLAETLSIDKFPELFIKQNTTTNTSFMDKLKTQIDIKPTESDELNDEYKNLKPGWTSIKKDNLTNKLLIVSKPSLEYNFIKPEKTEQELCYDVLNALCDLHERRTTEYIDLYGYDNWEKTFRFQNYDYDWVDRLDEKYEEENKKMMEMEDDPDKSNYVTDSDRYNKYWEL